MRMQHDVLFAFMRAARDPDETVGKLRRAQCLPARSHGLRDVDIELDIAGNLDA